MSEGNGKTWFARFLIITLWSIIWALLIGSFGWTTWCKLRTDDAFAAHCSDNKKDFDNVGNKIDKLNQNLIFFASKMGVDLRNK